jgi:DNA-binding response OmpR family regulator
MIKKSILLVDDDQRLRELLKDYLNEKNFQVFHL